MAAAPGNKFDYRDFCLERRPLGQYSINTCSPSSEQSAQTVSFFIPLCMVMKPHFCVVNRDLCHISQTVCAFSWSLCDRRPVSLLVFCIAYFLYCLLVTVIIIIIIINCHYPSSHRNRSPRRKSPANLPTCFKRWRC